MKCTIHPHSSIQSAEKCYSVRIAKKADSKIEKSGVAQRKMCYIQTKYSPPKLTNVNGIEIYTFYKGELK